MKLISGPDALSRPGEDDALRVVLYGTAQGPHTCSAGNGILSEIRRRKLEATPRAWDFLSFALSAATADFAGLRVKSADGWTRELELDVGVTDPAFWNRQAESLAGALGFLTTDRWRLHFHKSDLHPPVPRKRVLPEEDCVVLLSGGLDSLIGAIDLVDAGRRPFATSQIVRGDRMKQVDFASEIGDGLNHLQLNHNVHTGGPQETSQRARSLVFIAFGVLAATTLANYHAGDAVPLFICENGFIAINPPLTGGRVGSLSTRTAHPEFLGRISRVLDAAGLRVPIENPYRARTKGEMLAACQDQALLRANAAISTSCGRFQRFNYRHCGRCVPCQVRRAAFLAWGFPDTTDYVYSALGRNDPDHAAFDDVRAVAMAIASVAADGLDAWLGMALGSPVVGDRQDLRAMVQRGLDELQALHQRLDVQ